MKNYVLRSPESRGFCVPVILQALLISRGIDIPQNYIAQRFQLDSEGTGLLFNNGSLNGFLSEFRLKSEFQNPHENQIIYEEFGENLFGRFERGDVIFAYNFAHFQETEGNPGHVSLVSDFDVRSTIVTLSDLELKQKTFPLRKFIKGMDPWMNRNHGAYFVSEK